SSWNFNSTIRASNGSTANSITTFCGLPEEEIALVFSQHIEMSGGPTTEWIVAGDIGIGVNSTSTISGLKGSFGDARTSAGVGTSADATLSAKHIFTPALGINTFTCLEEITTNVTANSTTFFGTNAGMVLSATYRG